MKNGSLLALVTSASLWLMAGVWATTIFARAVDVPDGVYYGHSANLILEGEKKGDRFIVTKASAVTASGEVASLNCYSGVFRQQPLEFRVDATFSGFCDLRAGSRDMLTRSISSKFPDFVLPVPSGGTGKVTFSAVMIPIKDREKFLSDLSAGNVKSSSEWLVAQSTTEIEETLKEERLLAETKRIEDEKRLAATRDEERKVAEDERKRLEQSQIAEERRVAEEERLADEKKLAEERRLAEEKKLAEAKRAEDERKKLEQAQLAEAKRIAEERRMAEERKLAEEKRLAEEKKLAEAKRADQERAAKEAMQREQKLAAELREMKEQLQALQKNAPKPSVAVVGSRRLALVIGNDGYQSVPKLINARADARAMAKQLEATGFKVTLQFDLTERAMKDALRTFRTSVEGGDEVVVFFAGHGVQLGTANYLLPVDIRGDSEEQVKDEAIPLQRILDDLSDRKARFSLAIVDACRDNPFKTTGRSIGGRGLAPAAAASGQMVIFSAGTGQQALDRLGDKDKDPNGLFTRIFLKEMAKPGVPIDRVVRTVRNEVVQMAKSVGHEQVPALYDQTLGDFFFVR